MEASRKYLKLLSQQFPTITSTTTEIMNLEAILQLPKGTEHFITDLHGEYEAFEHVLRTGSGNVKRKIQDLYQFRLSNEQINSLATLVYYPEEKLPLIKESFESEEELNHFYQNVLIQLVDLADYSANKYTRSKVRKALPTEFAYIIEELLFRDNDGNKDGYYKGIINSMIELGQADDFIIAIAYLIQQLVVDHLHVVGDIYDRGPNPEKIIQRLKDYHSLDIQWGNHDVIWMGAAAGSLECIANVVRISARYDNIEIIEDVYGVSLRQLISFADQTYSTDYPETFKTKTNPYKDWHYSNELDQLAKIQQAMAVIQFKLEKQMIDRNPDFHMDDRLLLDKIDYENQTIELDGETFDLMSCDFPTIDPEDPYKLTEGEIEVMERLKQAFTQSEALQADVNFLINEGSLYLSYNNNLLIHAGVPMTDDGDYMGFDWHGETLAGKDLFDFFDTAVRRAFNPKIHDNHQDYLDLIWYLWTGPVSPLFAKHAMTTFERYYIEDESTHKEIKNPYYDLRNDEEVVEKILTDFGVNSEHGHIVNGHTPVKEKNGEDPMKANRRLLVIDGGFSKAYQKSTGIGGYTLLCNSYGMELAIHQPFTSREDAVVNESDILDTKRVVDRELDRITVADTDNGKRLKEQSNDLKQLLKAYRSGEILENL